MKTEACDGFEARLLEITRGDDAAVHHLATCRACAEEADDLAVLVGALHRHAGQIFADSEETAGPAGLLRRSRGAVRAAALAVIVALSGWLLATVTPVQRPGAALRGPASRGFGSVAARRVADSWRVEFEAVAGATGYELVVVSLGGGRELTVAGAAGPLELRWQDLEPLLAEGDVVWHLRAWNGVHLLAETAPIPVSGR